MADPDPATRSDSLVLFMWKSFMINNVVVSIIDNKLESWNAFDKLFVWGELNRWSKYMLHRARTYVVDG